MSPCVCLPANSPGRSGHGCMLMGGPQLVGGTDGAAWNLDRCAVYGLCFYMECFLHPLGQWCHFPRAKSPKVFIQILDFLLSSQVPGVSRVFSLTTERNHTEKIASAGLLVCTLREHTPWMWSPSAQGLGDAHEVISVCDFCVVCSQGTA